MNINSIDYVLGSSSTVYMDGKSVWHLRSPGKPGIRASLTLSDSEYKALRAYLLENLNLEQE